MDFMFALWLLAVTGAITVLVGFMVAICYAVACVAADIRAKRERDRRIEMYKAMSREYQRTGRKMW